MNTKKYLRIFTMLLSIHFLYGCALIDKHLFNPAASHARIDPLFRTPDCAKYVAEDGRHWLKSLLSIGENDTNFSTRNTSSLFFKESCEHQARSINDAQLTDGDRLYFKYCEGKDITTSPVQTSTPDKDACFNYLISKSDEICNTHKSPCLWRPRCHEHGAGHSHIGFRCRGNHDWLDHHTIFSGISGIYQGQSSANG